MISPRKDFPIFVIEFNINTMHELSIAIQIAEIIESEAIQAQAEKVTKVELEIGSLSGIEPTALELAVPEAFRGTMMEEAELVYHYIAALAVCACMGWRGSLMLGNTYSRWPLIGRN